jgi:hypothetical protein
MAFDGIICCDTSKAAKPHPLVLDDPRGEEHLHSEEGSLHDSLGMIHKEESLYK